MRTPAENPMAGGSHSAALQASLGSDMPRRLGAHPPLDPTPAEMLWWNVAHLFELQSLQKWICKNFVLGRQICSNIFLSMLRKPLFELVFFANRSCPKNVYSTNIMEDQHGEKHEGNKQVDNSGKKLADKWGEKWKKTSQVI